MSPKSSRKLPNLILFGIDSLRSDHMSCYGYPRLTTPHIDRFARHCAVFENTISANIPTTSAYTAMLTGMDLFSTQVVALRHKGQIAGSIRTLPEVLKEAGYNTSCVGFRGNPASRGFDQYLEYPGWGSWNEGRSPKAEALNKVALPELDRLSRAKAPFFLFLRHMDPHAPYLPPGQFERMWYHGNETDPKNHSMDPVMSFKPFRDFFASWMPPGISDKEYVIAQYDGEVAYMDSCMQVIFHALETRGLLDNSIVVINSDHGETLYDHDCFFDHHGLYEPTLRVPLMIYFPARIPGGKRVHGYNLHQDLMPTLMDLIGIDPGIQFDGSNLMKLVSGEVSSFPCEMYLTECTWMRKHGWRTPQWKLIVALEPDFHFKPEVELYNLVEDPGETHNLAESCPDVVAFLRGRMDSYIRRREQETGMTNPIYTQGDWHGYDGIGPFTSSQQAYDTLHIGDPNQAARLQAGERK